jgi:hypothetical protein
MAPSSWPLATAPDILVGDIDAVAAQQHGAMIAESLGHGIAQVAGANQGDRIEDQHVVSKDRARRVQRTHGFTESAQYHAARRMHMAYRLDIGAGLVNPRVNPKFSVRPAFAGKLIAVDIECQEIIHSHQRGTHARREYECVRARNPRADMAKGGGDALLVENVAGGDDVLL